MNSDPFPLYNSIASDLPYRVMYRNSSTNPTSNSDRALCGEQCDIVRHPYHAVAITVVVESPLPILLNIQEPPPNPPPPICNTCPLSLTGGACCRNIITFLLCCCNLVSITLHGAGVLQLGWRPPFSHLFTVTGRRSLLIPFPFSMTSTFTPFPVRVTNTILQKWGAPLP